MQNEWKPNREPRRVYRQTRLPHTTVNVPKGQGKSSDVALCASPMISSASTFTSGGSNGPGPCVSDEAPADKGAAPYGATFGSSSLDLFR